MYKISDKKLNWIFEYVLFGGFNIHLPYYLCFKISVNKFTEKILFLVDKKIRITF